MSLLGKLRTFFRRDHTVQETPLTSKVVRGYFASRGWAVSNTPTGIIDFFIERPDIGRFCVLLSKKPVGREVVSDMSRPAIQFAAIGLILSEPPTSQERCEQALHAGVVLLEWAHVDELEARHREMSETLKKELIFAKMSANAKLPRLHHSLSVPLTPQQRAKGFLVQTEEIACWFIDRGGDTLLVTFAQWGSDPALPTRWGETHGQAMSVSALGFETSSPNWYPEEHMLECVETALQQLTGRFPKRLLLGASQGGFAALRYSARLGASAVLAVSPPYSIDPVISTNARFGMRYVPSLNSGMHIAPTDLSGDVAICFDPYDESDSAQAAQIQDRLPCTLIKLPFAGHAPAFLLGNQHTMISMLSRCLGGQPADLGRLAARVRHENTGRAANMALYLSRRKPALACAIFEKFRDSGHNQSWPAVCYRLAEAGLAGRVVDWLQGVIAAAPTDPELSCCVALVGLKAGRLEVAYNAIALAVAAQPSNEKYQYVQNLITKARSVDGVTR